MVDASCKRATNINVSTPIEKSSSLKLGLGADYYSQEIPTAMLDTLKAQGKRIIYVTLGTVVSSKTVVWQSPLGHYADGNDEGEAEDGRNLRQFSGKDICQYIWRRCFEAFGDDDSLHIVMLLGPQPDVLVGMPEVPSNFTLRQAVPQLEMLAKCDLLVSHGGANSIHEALSCGVPLIVIPILGDQPVNADTLSVTNAGASFRHPLKSLTSSALREKAKRFLESPEGNPHRRVAQELAAKMSSIGGHQAAADAILEVCNKQHG